MPIEFWYSPAFLLLAADLALDHCAAHGIRPTSALGKAIGEGRAASLWAGGYSLVTGTEVWVRLVDPSQQAPDAEMMFITNTRGRSAMNRYEIEVASYTSFSKENLGDFLLRTKMTGKNAYSDRTVFVFFVQRGAQSQDIRDAHAQLKDKDLPGLAYLIGKADDDLYQTVQVYPELRGPADVRVSTLLAMKQLPVADVKRGMSVEQRMTEEPVPTENPYLVYL